MNQKITIRDVAKYAGVSAATVSYVINGVNKVSEETRDRVLKAIEHLNYHPNFTAISLSKRKSNMLGVMIPLVEDSLAPVFKGNHYYSEFIGGIEYVTRKKGYDFLISGIGNPEECKNWVTKRNLDGLIFLGLFPENFYKEMKALNIPIVLIDTYEKYSKFYHNIRIDDKLGGYLAVKHLIERGHSEICFVAPNLAKGVVDINRFLGYEKAIKEANLTVNEKLLIKSEGGSFEAGYKAGREVLKMTDHVSAIFTSSDILALGIIKALNEQGKTVPEDYSVVGFDDLIISTYSSPSLTTIRQDIFNKGAVSAELLIDAVELGVAPPRSLTLPVELVVRGSTGFHKA